jgi:site-specific recombinase
MIFTRAEIDAAHGFVRQARAMAEVVAEILRRGGDDDGAERMDEIIELIDAEAEYLSRLSAATPIGGRA